MAGALLHQASRESRAPEKIAAHPEDSVSVNLFDANDAGRLDAEAPEESPPVLLDRGGIIAHAQSQVQGGEGGCAHTARSRAERMDDSV
jgi:hypothetical protein